MTLKCKCLLSLNQTTPWHQSIKVFPLVPAMYWLALARGVEGVKEGVLDLLPHQRRHHVDLDLVTKAKGHQCSVEWVLPNMKAFFYEEATFCRFNFVLGPAVLDFCSTMRKDYFTLNSKAFPALQSGLKLTIYPHEMMMDFAQISSNARLCIFYFRMEPFD